ncbi:hypothetical protein K432DRAFT_383260 [Lepidopterella palustris CBS 459.81]|uniref:Zn(2)-C6 fungal-type domain-containing protein n=1 Tax=Lepidopterella palustris CBS 459.81 TaxID=1314670 RepID=A0A8E2JE26_9PEZI|nr:hypothetical protein K432DRAFT_383260 [Lepidopterella palustris CBS 459.81]
MAAVERGSDIDIDFALQEQHYETPPESWLYGASFAAFECAGAETTATFASSSADLPTFSFDVYQCCETTAGIDINAVLPSVRHDVTENGISNVYPGIETSSCQSIHDGPTPAPASNSSINSLSSDTASFISGYFPSTVDFSVRRTLSTISLSHSTFSSNGSDGTTFSNLSSYSPVDLSTYESLQAPLHQGRKTSTTIAINGIRSSEVPSPELTSAAQLSKKSTRPGQTTKRKRDHNVLEEVCAEVAITDKSGAIAAYSRVFGISKHQRQAYSAEERKEIARTRRLGACERCKRFKMKCHRPESPYKPCLRCLASNPQVLVLPCFLAKPVEAELFRDKPSIKHPLETPRAEVYRLVDIVDTERKFIKLQLTQDLGETLEVYVTKYEPRPNEMTAHPWKDRSGCSRTLEMPPYCIARMDEARQNVLEYIESFRGAFLSNLSRCANEITGEIMDEARRFSAFNPTCTVRKAIDLFAANRIIENDWRICGEESLGVGVIEEEDNPWFGKMPVTPIMDTQLDQIVIQGFLKPLKDQMLKELQEKIYENRRENWFEIFLTISILLTNAEWLLKHSRNNAKRYGAKSRYNSLDRAYSYFHTCNLLIAHFHFVCVGFAPLKLDWKSADTSTMAILDSDQRRFMEQIQEMIRRKEKYVLQLREENEYEAELYWCHQIFLEKWDPVQPCIEEVVEK